MANVTLDHISFRYKKNGADVLKDINGEIGPGLYLLLGENGAGKTTLLHIISGLLYPREGECLLDGAPVRRQPSIESRIAFLGADTKFPLNTLADMVKYHAPFFPNFSMEALKYNLDKFGVNIKHPLKSLSMGNHTKATTSYMLSLNVDVLLLDEPATGLDIEGKETLQHLIATNLCEGQTVIVSTHNFGDLQNLYDGVILMHKGVVQACVTFDRLLSLMTFVRSHDVPEHAIYSETVGDGYHSLVCVDRADEMNEIEIDYRLLYHAMRDTTAAEKIINILNRQHQ